MGWYFILLIKQQLLCWLVIGLPLAVLFLPVIKAWGDVMPMAELGRTVLAAKQFFNYLALKL